MSKIHSGRKRFFGLCGDTDHRLCNRGFSLVEVLVVVLIMGIVVGVIGSLMGGFIRSFEITDDQSIARRRAADVFNILQNPMLYAGMGIPADSFAYYFEPINGVGGAPIENWGGGPISIVSEDLSPVQSGPVMRVVYTVPAGIKSIDDDVTEFSSESAVEKTPDVEKNETPLDPGNGFVTTPKLLNLVGSSIQGKISVSDYDVRSYVTFPGIRMHPSVIQAFSETVTTPEKPVEVEIHLVGKVSRQKDSNEETGDVFADGRNVIRQYHDMYLVRASVAFVDSEDSTFYFADVTNNDVVDFRSVGDLDGFRVEGIKAVHFEPMWRPSSLGDYVIGVTVYVIAEGDNAITGRGSGASPSQTFRTEARWNGLTFEDEVYYEEFQMQWRTRNIEATGA